VVVDFEAGQYLAQHIPNAQLVELAGADHPPWLGDTTEETVQSIGEFLTGSKSRPDIQSVLATVLFTDIVDSTKKAEQLGDQRWFDLLEAHNKVVRFELERFRGKEIKATGDGFLMTFDGPARAIQCAMAIAHSVGELGLDIRAGLHTGQVDVSGNDVHGIAVNIAARVAALAGARQTLVSRTVRDLVAGSGIEFAFHGKHALKGLTEPMEIYDTTY